MTARSPALPPRFEAVRRIGLGGMGVVYEAMDTERGVRVALKTILHHDADALARFKHEFRALQGIHHPNLIELGELLGDADEVFFTMELVEGVDLLTWVRGAHRKETTLESATAVDLPSRDLTPDPDTVVDLLVEPPEAMTSVTPLSLLGTPRGGSPFGTPQAGIAIAEAPAASGVRPASFDEPRVRDAFRQIALGLTALHDAERIHRDIKPSNVRVTPEGRVVLLDFGLVLTAGDPERSEVAIVGTPAYMAPEQAASTPVGPAADWYSVGAMLYQCLTGRLPFEGANLAVMMAKQYHDPPAPSTLVSAIAPDLDALCADLLKFEPAARPTGREVLRRLNVGSSPWFVPRLVP